MDATDRQLVALNCFSSERITFLYKLGRWEFSESLQLWDIREALKVSLEKIDDAFPDALAKAAELDHKEWKVNWRRTRRYISESAGLIYPDSPHLQAQIVAARGFYVPTNINWDNVLYILRLLCKAAGIDYGGPSSIKHGVIEPARMIQSRRWIGTPDTATSIRIS